MSQRENTMEALKEHFTELATEEQRRLVSDEFVTMTIKAEQLDLEAWVFFQMVATIIGAGTGGHGPEVSKDDKFNAMYLAVAMFFVGADAASNGELTYEKFQKWAKRKVRDEQRRK